MHGFVGFEFLVGVAVGKILLGAMFASWIFRNVALATTAFALCFVYIREGVAGILILAHRVQIDLFIRPDFSKGLAVGAIVAFIVFGFYRGKYSTGE